MAAEMWIWRRMLGVSWKEKRKNASILSELDVKKELLGKIMTLKLAYFGHIMRGSGSSFTLQIVEGLVEGKRKRGRQNKQWFDNIREWTGLSYMRAKCSAQDRSAWRRTIKRGAEGGRQSSGVTAAASANGHCTASQYSAIPKHRVLLRRTNQKIHHNFSVFECMEIAQNYAEVSLPSPHSI